MRRLLPVAALAILFGVAAVIITADCALKGDSDCDGSVSDFELLSYIDQWVQGSVGDFDVLEAIGNWAEAAATTSTSTTTIASTSSTTTTTSTTTIASTTTTTIAGTTTTTVAPDECGNDVGNGYDIVSGPSGPTEHDQDDPFRSLTVHPDDENIVLIGTERNGFVRSTDGGDTWTRLRNGLTRFTEDTGDYPEIYDIAYSGSNASIIYAATLNGPGPVMGSYPTSNGGVYKSVDGGNNWSRKNCGLDNGCVESIHVNPDDPDNVVIGIRGGETTFMWGDIEPGEFYGGGIYRTVNGGENWSRVDIVSGDNNNTYRRIIAAGSNSSLLFTFGFKIGYPSSNVGFLKSTDGGATWSQFAPELREYGVAYFAVSSDGNTIYAVADDYNIYKSVDRGETWSDYRIDSSGYGIDISPDDANRVLFSKFNSLYLTTDGFGTEAKVIDTTESMSDVVFAPSNTSVAYAVTIGYDVYRSVDSGASFSKLVNLRDDVLNVVP